MSENIDMIPNTEDSSHNAFNFIGLRGALRQNEPLSKHTSWRVGGPAQWFYEPADVADLAQLLQQLPDNIPIFWLGLGSNLLVRDGGMRGIMILTAGLLNKIKQLDDNTLSVEAGVSSAKVARFAVRAGLTGAEFLAGIPGTFGGALAMNAGAWGGETWSLVQTVKTLNKKGKFNHRLLTDYEIGYRHVNGPKNEWFVAATLQLSPNPRPAGHATIQALLKQRNEKQPTGLPTCGSVFKNPPGDHAARLIEQAGWKGRSVGGASVSEKHANFILNHNGATAADIENLIQQIQADVKQKYQISLVPEVHIVGEYQ